MEEAKSKPNHPASLGIEAQEVNWLCGFKNALKGKFKPRQERGGEAIID